MTDCVLVMSSFSYANEGEIELHEMLSFGEAALRIGVEDEELWKFECPVHAVVQRDGANVIAVAFFKNQEALEKFTETNDFDNGLDISAFDGYPVRQGPEVTIDDVKVALRKVITWRNALSNALSFVSLLTSAPAKLEAHGVRKVSDFIFSRGGQNEPK